MEFFFAYVFCFLIVSVSSSGLNLEFSWTRINYEWPNTRQRFRRSNEVDSRYGGESFNRHAESIIFEDPDLEVKPIFGNIGKTSEDLQVANDEPAGDIDYQYENNIPMGANVWKNKLFITVPRRRLGVPSTLNYVSLDNPNRQNTPLIPYPNWSKNLYPDPRKTGQNFVSVYRVAADPCDRLWFVDTGLIELPGSPIRVRPPTLIIMDLNTDTIIHSFEIPADQLRPNTALASLSIDVTKSTCGDAFAYIPDLGGYGLIVFSLRDNKSWRVSHNYFYLEPTAGEFFVSGHRFQWNDGIFSTELTSPKPDGYRDLYFHSMAGTNMYKVSTKILKNETASTRSYHEDDFQNIGDRGAQSQTSSADIHESSGVMFLGLVNQNALACWNTNRPLNTISLVQRDDKTMIYPCDVKVRNDKVYVLTNTMPEFLFGRLNYDTVNFRVWSNTVERAIAGTMCEATRFRGNGGGKYY